MGRFPGGDGGGPSGTLTDVITENNLSNVTGWVGTTIQRNRVATNGTSTFVNSAAGNYMLLSTAPAVNRGLVIPGITDGYYGSAPDEGAFEYGTAAWTAGANWNAWVAANQARRAVDVVSLRSIQRYAGHYGDPLYGKSHAILDQWRQPCIPQVRPVECRYQCE